MARVLCSIGRTVCLVAKQSPTFGIRFFFFISFAFWSFFLSLFMVFFGRFHFKINAFSDKYTFSFTSSLFLSLANALKLVDVF